jgi:hypothetical protein
VHAQQACQITPSAHLLVDILGNLLLLVPFSNVRLDGGFDPLANLGAEGGVGFIVVGRVVLESDVSSRIAMWES